MENYILNKLEELKDDNLTSFHVPGHKMGKIFQKLGYKNILGTPLWCIFLYNLRFLILLKNTNSVIKYWVIIQLAIQFHSM